MSRLFFLSEFLRVATWAVFLGWLVFLFAAVVSRLVTRGKRQKIARRAGRSCGRWSFGLGLGSLVFLGILLILSSPSGLTYASLVNSALPMLWGHIPRQKYLCTVEMGREGKLRLTDVTPGRELPVWSPDGTRMAFVEKATIYLADADGRHKKPLTQGQGLKCLAWSPDGRKIAFLSQQPEWAYDNYEIYVVNDDGNQKVRLTDISAHNLWWIFPLAWSPDSKKIVFITRCYSRNRKIYLINADGSGKRQLFQASREIHSLSWPPQLGKIVYVTRGQDGSEVYFTNSDRSDGTCVRLPFGSISPLAWSPQGDKVIFSAGDSIYAINPDGGAMTRLTQTPEYRCSLVAWSPDGKKVAFVGSQGKIWWHLFVINADGSGKVQLPRMTGWFDSLAWSPNGDRIVFSGVFHDPRLAARIFLVMFMLLAPFVLGIAAPVAVWLGVDSLHEEKSRSLAIVGLVCGAIPAIVFVHLMWVMIL